MKVEIDMMMFLYFLLGFISYRILKFLIINAIKYYYFNKTFTTKKINDITMKNWTEYQKWLEWRSNT